MSKKIIIPALGESINEATIAKLVRKTGDFVNIDDVILELETEKVNIDISAQASGVIEGLDKKEGDAVSVGEVIGTINSKITNNKETKNDKESDVLTNTNEVKTLTDDIQYPPSVSKLLAENNLDPKTILGTGKRGMLTKGDVLEAIANPAISISSTNVNTVTSEIENKNIISKDLTKSVDVGSTINATSKEAQNIKSSDYKREERVKMSRLRQTIAKRLKDSQNTAAILTTFNEINMSKVMQLRTTYKETFEKKYNTKLGFMSFFVKAVVDALQSIPAINAEIQGDEIIYKNYYDIGIAVGGAQGLVVPVIRNCKNLTFAQIESEIVDYSNKAKAGKLSIEDLTGATFTISNGGVYGSLLSTPIINPPQSGILGLHKIEERPIVYAGKIEIQPMMYVALSYDHRIIDGQDAVKFLVKVKDNIENPARLLLNV